MHEFNIPCTSEEFEYIQNKLLANLKVCLVFDALKKTLLVFSEDKKQVEDFVFRVIYQIGRRDQYDEMIPLIKNPKL